MTKLSIILPCYNEAESIDKIVTTISRALNKDSEVEIILVDNGSTDSTSEKITEMLATKKCNRFKAIRVKENIGYGNGIMEGVRAANGEVIAWTHADLQTDPVDVLDAHRVFLKNPQYPKCILKGRRKERNLIDTFFTTGMSMVASLMLKMRLSDVNAQPKMFHRDFLEILPDPPVDFSLDLYFLFQAQQKGFEVVEYPVNFGKRLHGEAKGGGTLKGKWKLIIRTWNYMLKLKRILKR